MQRRLSSAAFVTVMCLGATRAPAEAFEAARYDPASDAVVVTIVYSGTNPGHEFSLAWDACVNHPDGSSDVTAQLIDSQARDPAREDFRKTVSLSLAQLPCRPARLTLHASPNAYVALEIPASR